MNVYIAGTDITQYADVKECKVIDAGAGESDRIEITFGAAEDFFKWKPCAGEILHVTDDGLDTGEMPIALEIPGSGTYTVIAAAMPETATYREWTSYDNATVGSVIQSIARKLNVEWGSWGIESDYAIKYAAQLGESVPEFIARLLTPQAGLIKWQSGRICTASLNWLMARSTVATIELRADGANFDYTFSDTARIKRADVISPFGTGSAQAESGSGVLTITDAPVFSSAQAIMWAEGALKLNNLGAETLDVSLDYNASIYAWGMYETTGAYTGKWLATRVEHDLKNRRTSVILEK